MFILSVAHKIFASKIQVRPVNAGLYIAFQYRFSFVTVLATDFCCKLVIEIVSELLRAAI